MIAAERPFRNTTDLAQRVPLLRKNELEQLAFIGALNSIGAKHRRDALWQSPAREYRQAHYWKKCLNPMRTLLSHR